MARGRSAAISDEGTRISRIISAINLGRTTARTLGGGMASNVVQFFSILHLGEDSDNLQTRQVAQDGEPNETHYAYYVRMNGLSGAAFTAAYRFYAEIYRRLRQAEPAYWIPGTELEVPDIILSVEADTPLYNDFAKWIKDIHRGGSGRQPKDFNDSKFYSISVVQGRNAIGITDMLEQMPNPNAGRGGQRNLGAILNGFEAHAKALGALHAIDVALGMADRLQNENIANITVDPATGRMVLIDVDVFLPPTLGASGIEQIENQRSESLQIWSHKEREVRYMNERFGDAPMLPNGAAWDFQPPRLPYHGDYAADLQRAIEHDLQRFDNYLDYAVNAFQRRNGATYHGIQSGTAASTYAHANFSAYQKRLHAHRSVIKEAATKTFQVIQQAVRDPALYRTLGILFGDPAFSINRLVERSSKWRF